MMDLVVASGGSGIVVLRYQIASNSFISIQQKQRAGAISFYGGKDNSYILPHQELLLHQVQEVV